MADKRATVYIVDTGKSMGVKRHGRDESDLDYALRYVWDKITTTISNDRKTDKIGVIGLRTDETNNELAKDEAYENISVFAPIDQFLMSNVRELQSLLVPSNTNNGDGISALVTGIQMIMSHCKHLKYIKSVILVTNGTGQFDIEGLDEIVSQIHAQNINLTVLGVDFDDEDYGCKEEGKSAWKRKVEENLKKLCADADGVFGTVQEAVEELGRPRIKTVRPVASYKGPLSLGDANKYDTALTIDVERYPRTMVAKPVSASRFAMASSGDNEANGSKTVKVEDKGGNDLQAVRQERAYQVENEEVAGEKMEIDKEEMEKGYTYGRTVVPISATDEEVTVLATEPSMQIVGFIAAEKYKRYFHMSTTNIIVGQKGNEKAAVALSSLIHALYELESYALVRFVRRKNDAPAMMILAPSIEADFECLIDVQVPFVEDVRPFRFPPLGKVKTVTGKTLDKHRNLPTHDMEKYMGDYIDSMDLSELEKGDDGEPIEYAPPEDTFSPVLHRINQVIRHRAIHRTDTLPPIFRILTKYSQPPEEVIERSRKHLKKLIEACDVKKVEQKSQSKKRTREQPKPKSGLDIEALLSRDSNKRLKVSLSNAVPEFKQQISNLTEESEFRTLGKIMFEHVKELVKTSFADVNYPRVCEILGVVRTELRELEVSEIYNDLIRGLKEDVGAGKLDGNRKDLWEVLRKSRLGLISGDEEGGDPAVTEEMMAEFWKI